MPLKVIGAGFPRTGTMSLKLALEQLGLGPCHHMRELLAHPDRVNWWSDAADGRSVDWERIFEGYQSTTDAPACHFYKELAALYPDAKLILSVRDPESWFASTQATILSAGVQKFHGPTGVAGMMNKIGWGSDPRLRDKGYMLARYQRHNDEVRSSIPQGRLLVFEAEIGWGPLCAFLELSVPETPYPSTNARAEWAARMERGHGSARSDEASAPKPGSESGSHP